MTPVRQFGCNIGCHFGNLAKTFGCQFGRFYDQKKVRNSECLTRASAALGTLFMGRARR
jgi:hypothetical protein